MLIHLMGGIKEILVLKAKGENMWELLLGGLIGGLVGASIESQEKKAQNNSNSKKNIFSEGDYRKLLRKYYKKYKDQVFKEKYLLEIQQQIYGHKETSEIKKDLKVIRKELENNEEKAKKEGVKKDNSKNNFSLEQIVFEEVNQIPKSFDYNIADIRNKSTLVGMHVHIVCIVIKDQNLLSREAIEHVKGNLEKKKKRCATLHEYSENLDENIIFQLCKYADVINMFDSVYKHSRDISSMDYNVYLEIVHSNCRKLIENIEDEMKRNRAVFDLVFKYRNMDIAEKQYDYVCATLMINVLLCAMNYVLYGHIEKDGRKIPMYTLVNQFTAKENITALNTIILNEVVKELTKQY